MSGDVEVAVGPQESIEFEVSSSGDAAFEEASSCLVSDSQGDDGSFREVHWERCRWETLSGEDVYRKILLLTDDVSTVVGVGREDLMGMLIAYKWHVEEFQEDWFSEPERVRSRLGLGECVKVFKGESTCQICLDSFDTEKDMLGCGCGHYMCKECWKQYGRTAIENGPLCLDIRCPVYKCRRRVPAALLEEILSSKSLERMKVLAIENFVEKSSDIVWCPGVDCGKAVRVLGGCEQARDVTCASCCSEFCFHCMEEGHRPVNCEVVRYWKLENSDNGASNMEWILQNTKACPGCKKPIEKFQGCMHMTCSQCRHEFCWLCMGPWKLHSDRTGGFYNCNRPEASFANDSKSRNMYFWERWAEQNKALRIVRESKKFWEEEELESFSKILQIDAPNLAFVTSAWKEIERCRKVLKWAYVAAYFSFDQGLDAKYKFIKSNLDSESLEHVRKFFEFTQKDAELVLERLSYMAEVELPKFKERLNEASSSSEENNIRSSFDGFRQDLVGLTDVTRTQFLKLVRWLEHGLDTTMEEIRSQSSENPVPHTWKNNHASGPQVNNKRCAGHASEAIPEAWRCSRCQLLNDAAASTCDLCDLRKL